MKVRDYLRIATLEALEAQGGFSDSLEAAARRLPDPPPVVWSAMAQADEGDLRSALWSLRHFGLSNTFVLAASGAPSAAHQLNEALRALPATGTAAFRLAQTVLYAWLMLLFGGSIWGVLQIWVFPVFSKMLEREVTLGSLSGAFFTFGLAPAMALGGILLVLLLDPDRRERLVARLSGDYDAARALLAAGVLVEQGQSAAEALALLDPRAREAGHRALGELSQEGLESRVLLEAGRSLADRGAARLERRIALIRSLAVVFLGVLYGSIAIDLYRIAASLTGGLVF